jgi:hypothetical protein
LQPWLHRRTLRVVADDLGWVLLAYRLPREPSAPRVTVWRKLRRLGVVQVVDGLVTLPESPETVEAFDWLADEVLDAGGEAWTWRAMCSKQQDRALRQQLRDAVAAEYTALTAAAKEAVAEPKRRTVERLRRTLRDIERRDHIGPRERDDARRALQRLAASLDGAEARATNASFVFVDDPADVPSDATPFDMRGVELSHHNGDCTFETILHQFDVDDPVLWEVAQVVHEADLADDRFDEPAAAGLDAICRGLTFVADDHRVLEVTAVMFDGLYEQRRRALLGGAH